MNFGKFKKGDMVTFVHNSANGVVTDVIYDEPENRYAVFSDGRVDEYYESQLRAIDTSVASEIRGIAALNAALTSEMIMRPNDESLYSLNSAKINFIPYQFRPVLKIIKSDRPRMLIADGVGVGKTIEAGLIVKELEARQDIKSVMVICPKPLITEGKWASEMERFGEKFLQLDGRTLRYCISECDKDGYWPEQYSKCVVPYSLLNEELLIGDGKRKKGLVELDPPPKFDLIIVDEAHHIKNPSTFAYKAVQLLCESAESVIFLTATPIQLGSMDLLVLLNLLRPDLVVDKTSFSYLSEPNPFINKAILTIRNCGEGWREKACDELAKAAETAFGEAVLVNNALYKCIMSELKGDKDISQERRVKMIAEVESLYTFFDIINRTRRKDIGEFTIRKSETVTIKFTKEQEHLYNSIMSVQAKILRRLHSDINLRFLMCGIMRQAASCINGLVPFLNDILKRHFDELDGLFAEYSDVADFEGNDNFFDSLDIKQEVEKILRLAELLPPKDPKVDKLIEVLSEKGKSPQNKVMVFSSFRHTLKYLNGILEERGFRVGMIHGDIPDDERVTLRDRFKLPREDKNAFDVLLFSEVGCEGLDYQFCDCMVNYDLPWNPMRIEQRIGRIDRNGQKSESVSIVNMITEGTIDYDIYYRCLVRIGVFEASIGDGEEILGEITKEINNIAQQYVLNPEESRKKLQQLSDNAIRLVQEQEQLESAQEAFFGLDLSQGNFAKEVEEASNIYLGAEAIENLVRKYLSRRLDGMEHIGSIDNNGIARLRLSRENKDLLLEDFKKLPQQKTIENKRWKTYLESSEQYLLCNFDGYEDDSERDAALLCATHPLVKQAAVFFKECKVGVIATEVAGDLQLQGEHEYIIYEWHYRGLKDRFELIPVASSEIDGQEMMKLLFDSHDTSGDGCNTDLVYLDGIRKCHYAVWKEAKQNFIEETQAKIKSKKESLKHSYETRIETLQEQLNTVASDSIGRMIASMISKRQREYEAKVRELDEKLEKVDITFREVVCGKLTVTEESDE